MKGHPLAQAGMYTSYLQDTGTGPIPASYGYATLHISKTGAAMLSGKLPDGSGFTASSNVVAEGTSAYIVILNDQSLYNRKGGLTGYFEFSPLGFGGIFAWEKPLTKGPYYPTAFNTLVGIEGFPYSKTIGNTLTSGTIEFLGGMLAGSGTSAGFTFSNKRYVFNPPNPLNVKLAINAATGAVKGSFDFPQTASSSSHPLVKYSGLLLQDGTTAVAIGHFRSPIVSGSGTLGIFEAIP